MKYPIKVHPDDSLNSNEQWPEHLYIEPLIGHLIYSYDNTRAVIDEIAHGVDGVRLEITSYEEYYKI